MSRTAPKAGFTMVELAALVIVLSLLVLIGVPTLVRASQKTKQATCESNLKEVGMAIESYSEAADGRLPGPAAILVDARYGCNSTNELAWFIAPKLGSREPGAQSQLVRQLLCPAHTENGERSSMEAIIDYSLGDGHLLGSPPFGRVNNGAAAMPLSLEFIKAMSSPAEAVVMSDADKGNVNPTLPGWNSLSYTPVHGTARNQLYFDWHVGRRAW